MIRDLLKRLLPDTSEPAVPGPSALVMVYHRGARYYIEASDRTRWQEAGFWVASGTLETIDVAAADEVVGAALLAALRACRVEVPVPPREAKLEAGLFKAMGVRSRRASMSGTQACVVTREGPRGNIRIEPQVNGGPTGEARGYRPLSQKARMLPGDAPSALVGQALRLALADSTAVT